MSNRYRLASMAYPSDYRADHFPELAATADELANGNWSMRQAWSLLRHGLDTRCRLATSGSTAQVWRSGVRLGLIVAVLTNTLLSALVGTVVFRSFSEAAYNLGSVALAVLTIGFLAGNVRIWATALMAVTSSMTSFIATLFTPGPMLAPAVTVVYVAIVAAVVWWATSPVEQPPDYQKVSVAASLALSILAAFVLPLYLIAPTMGGALQVGAAATGFGLFLLLVGSFVEPRLAAGAAVYVLVSLVGRGISLTLFEQGAWFNLTELAVAIAGIVAAVGFAQLSRRGSARLAAL